MTITYYSCFISVVVINLNNLSGLKRTLASIAIQSYQNYELIYVDGGSIDGSIEFVAGHGDRRCQKIIGQDNGIYNAMNLGIEQASGDYLLFLNSGDFLIAPNIFAMVAQTQAEQGGHPLIFGYAQIQANHLQWLFPPEKIAVNHNHLNKWLATCEPIHQTMFFPQDFYREYRYDENLKIIADKRFKRSALQQLDYVFLDRAIASFATGGISTQINSFQHLIRYVQDFERYYLQGKHSLHAYRLFLQESCKLLLRFLVQKYLKDRFWRILKLAKGY
jgi:glycosyltransferase involved in cell wall biosynthesis